MLTEKLERPYSMGHTYIFVCYLECPLTNSRSFTYRHSSSEWSQAVDGPFSDESQTAE